MWEKGVVKTKLWEATFGRVKHPMSCDVWEFKTWLGNLFIALRLM